jgi:hypothetical protein
VPVRVPGVRRKTVPVGMGKLPACLNLQYRLCDLSTVVTEVAGEDPDVLVVFAQSEERLVYERALQAVTKEVIGIHVLPTRPLFACDILRR